MNFKRSATPATPLSRPYESSHHGYSWVNGWFNPTEDYTSAEISNLKLKGWYKSSNAAPVKKLTNFKNDVTDLSNWKYYTDVPIIERTKQEKIAMGVPEEEVEKDDILATNPEGTPTVLGDALSGESVTKDLPKDEVKLALAIDTENGHVGSISEAGIEAESTIP